MSDGKITAVLRCAAELDLAGILQNLDMARNRRYALADVRRDFVRPHTRTLNDCIKYDLCDPVIYSIIYSIIQSAIYSITCILII